MSKHKFIGGTVLCAAAGLTLCAEAFVRLDISGETARQTVIAEGGRTLPDGYQGHPTTVLTREGKLICVWTLGHGGPCGPAAESADGGRTWARIDDRFPAVYRTMHKNCPTLQKCVCRDGHERLLVFSAKRRDPTKMKGGFEQFSWNAPLGIMISDDGGRTWREGTPAEVSSNMPPTGFMQLKDGSLALFGQVRLDAKAKTDGPKDDQGIWMSVSRDDGETWSPMRIVAQAAARNLCEPCCLRSPDGKALALLMRENRHRDCSMMCFSSDEGRTWTRPVLTAPQLTGDRHEGIMLDDGRYLVCFRDQMKDSPTAGQYVGWVGSWDDIAKARPGDLRIRLLNHHGKHGVWPGNEWDTGYSGVEKLADGTILCTTYTKHFDDDRYSSVVATRLYPSDFGASVAVDATQPGAALPNSSQVLTFWNGVMTGDRSPIAWPKEPRQDYPIGFVRYAELMACTGGNKSRDLFKNPDDRTVLDDYDFVPLVTACRGILGCGMKPYLKLGNVPAKFSSDYDGGEFLMNIRPPTDDLVHYRYMKACAAVLKQAFGRDEVRSWRFAVLTEADNTGWFQAKSKSKVEIREAFFRLYDYAARAFEEELGPNLVFGTHLLYPDDPNCPQSQFSVEEVVAHCVAGTNAATGKIGAPLRLLTASYYGVPDRDDLSQGRCTNLRRIRTVLDKAVLTDVVTGVDEGRVIIATPGRERRDLASRAVGASYQAAFDVRVIKEIFDDRMDYFATWGYFSGPRVHFEGIPSHHYFSLRELAKFEGFKRAPAHVSGKLPTKEEMDAIAGVSADGRTVRAVVARFRDKLVFTNRLETTIKFRLPKDWAGMRARVTTLTLDDSNNWFVDWERDRVARGVTPKDSNWSWDDFAVLSGMGLRDEKLRAMFAKELQPRYAVKASSVRPTETTEAVSADATLTLPVSFVGNGAAFLSVEAVACAKVNLAELTE